MNTKYRFSQFMAIHKNILIIIIAISSPVCAIANTPTQLLNQRQLSEDQRFLVPSNAEQDDYIGYIKAYPEFEYLGTPATFSLGSPSTTFDLASNGLLTIKDPTKLNTGVTSLKALVSKDGYANTEITVSIDIVDADSCVFIDYSSPVNGNGKRNSPKNIFEPKSNTIFLFKRGTVRVGKAFYISSIDSIILESYGVGENFTFSCSQLEGARVMTVGGGSDSVVISNINFRFENYNYMSTSTVGNNALYFPSTNGGTNFTLRYCEIYNAGGGISASAHAETFDILFCRVRNIGTDGIFLAKPGISTNRVIGTYIHDVNELFYLNEDQNVSHGDNFQNDQTDTRLLHCLFDHSSTGNKFCVISGSYDITIRDCYFINHPDRIGFYSIKNSGIIENCTFVGGTNGIWAHSGNELKVNYCRFYKQSSSAITNPGADSIRAYNNIFYNCNRAVSRTGYILKNNIFSLKEGQIAYNLTDVIDSDYNLFHAEHEHIFQYNNTLSDTRDNSQELNSLVGDPLFVNSEALNFRIKANSPAITAGLNVSLMHDFEATELKPGSPNIGLYERVDTIAGPYSSVDYQSNNNSIGAVEVFPMPVKNTVNIKCQNPGKLIIIDIHGVKVLERFIPNGVSILNIDIPSGIYFIGFEDNKSIPYLQKLVVAK
ncbi:MAG: T9SS type A sorting domain-containing protein [Bacteroidales bacterium]|nr:T9SS type A sorting domain-containing protein [Bacteroidales bacterium]